MTNRIEQELIAVSESLLDGLLIDRTMRRNICWATDHYASRGAAYAPGSPMTWELVAGTEPRLVRPRVRRPPGERGLRTKKNAEVFTPAWVCNLQNNLFDEAWFGRPDVFNRAEGKGWEPTVGRIAFPEGKSWQSYVGARCLEITCGEAPYLTSRYDAVTGAEIPVGRRIGLLDRKLRVVGENTEGEGEWFRWARRAYESIYGYEFQGDSLLIARENLLCTLLENMELRFGRKPDGGELRAIVEIVSWNVWQMEGLSMTAPFSSRPKERPGEFAAVAACFSETEPVPCRIFDWREGKSLEFRDMLGGRQPAMPPERRGRRRGQGAPA